MADIFRYNTSLTKVTLGNLGGEEKSFIGDCSIGCGSYLFQDLGLALKENSKHALQIINFADNQIGNRGMISLGEAFQVLELFSLV